MGYSTDFTGRIQIVPPLNPAEIDYLQEFADGEVSYSDHKDEPDSYCSFEPDDSGAFVEWSYREKTSDAVEWVQFLINHFLREGAIASTSSDEQFEGFTFNHILNGELEADGEESRDLWLLKVVNNRVTRHEAIITYSSTES